MRRAVLLLLLPMLGCAAEGATRDSNPNVKKRADGSIEVYGGRVIPAMPRLLGVREQYELRYKWLEEKHRQLLPRCGSMVSACGS